MRHERHEAPSAEGSGFRGVSRSFGRWGSRWGSRASAAQATQTPVADLVGFSGALGRKRLKGLHGDRLSRVTEVGNGKCKMGNGRHFPRKKDPGHDCS